VAGNQLAGADLDQMAARTEGWLVGLQLLGLSMRGHADHAKFLNAFTGTQRHILDYLTNEVLRQQSASRQEFLLCTSILDPLSGPLCDAIMETTDGQDMLEELHQAGLFVSSLDQQRLWFRYHALFAEALRYQLERARPALVRTLHSRASHWYAAAGQTSDAIDHALKAQEWDFAADLIDSAAWILLSGKGKMLWNWLQQIPAAVVSARPRLCQLNISLINRVGPLKEAFPWLEALERAIVAAPLGQRESAHGLLVLSERDREQLLGQIAASRALITAYYGDGERASGLCEEALLHLAETDHFEHALVAAARAGVAEGTGQATIAAQQLLEAGRLHQVTGNLADAVLNMSSAAVFLHLQGRLHEAWQTCQQAIELVAPYGGPPSALAGFAYARQAYLLREWNQLDAALERVQESIHLGQEIGYPLALLPGYEVIVPILLSQGDLDAAEAYLKELRQLPCIVDNLCLRAWWFTSSRVRLWLLKGDVAHAKQWADMLALEKRSSSPFTREREDVARVRVFLALQQQHEALSLLQPLTTEALCSGRSDHLIEMHILTALAHVIGKDEHAALSALADAIHLAEPEGYIRSFVDEGPPMALLLSKLREQHRRQGSTPYLDTLLAAFVTERREAGKSPTAVLPDPLSAREIDVIQELARGASNQDIADRLVLSIETVKRHLYNIFLKLGVNNRTQAVIRAQYLGILSDDPE
jgi:LuxR family maltose regulon positive regulatory protein